MRSIETNDVVLSVDDQGSGDAVVLLHGFPEIAYSWRNQVPALADAGYRAIAFDQRGYGGSSKPEAVDSYGLIHLVGDVIGLLDRLGIETATVVGHDWGSIVAWTAAITHPDRVARVGSLNVPYRGSCVGFPPIDHIREHLADRFGYILMFQEEGLAESMFAADPDAWLRTVFAPIAADTAFLTDDVFSVFKKAFVDGGLTGPLGWYRNIDRNAAEFASYADAPITQPTLMLSADSDPILPVTLADGMERWVADLTLATIAGSGHWTQQEQPEAVNDALIEWLAATS